MTKLPEVRSSDVQQRLRSQQTVAWLQAQKQTSCKRKTPQRMSFGVQSTTEARFDRRAPSAPSERQWVQKTHSKHTEGGYRISRAIPFGHSRINQGRSASRPQAPYCRASEASDRQRRRY